MSVNPWDEIEEYVRTKKAQAASSQDRDELRSEIGELKTGLASLTESVQGFLKGSAPNGAPPAEGGTPGAQPSDGAGDGAPPPPDPEPHPDESLPVEVVRKLAVPRIYTGDDEPSEVPYIDPDSGEKKTRPGRRKNHPAGYEVEPYEAPAEPEGEGAE